MLRAQGEKILSILSIYRILLITFVPCTKAVFTDTQVQLACVQTSPLPQEPFPIFPEGGGPSVHRLKFSVRNNYVNPQQGGVLPHVSYMGMCRPIGWGFCAVLVWRWVYTLPILVWNRVWFSGELRECMNVFIVSIAKQSVFTQRASSQTKGLERGWKQRARPRERRLSPNYFQKFKRMPAPDWAQKMLCIIEPNRRRVSPEFFSWVRTQRLLSVSFTKLVRARESFIFYFPNQKQRNYRWVEKTFGMLSAGAIQFAPRIFCFWRITMYRK